MWSIPINDTIEHPEWGDYVWRNKNGSITDPMQKAKNFYVFNFNLTIGSFALPLNLYVAFVILSDTKLRNDPKYVVKLIGALCSLITLLSDGQEIVYYLWPNEELCHSSIFTLGWSNLIFIFNTFLALVDQFFAITKPKLYRQKVTPLIMAVWSVILNFLLILLLDFVYIFEVDEIHCAFNAIHAMTLLITWFLLFISSAILTTLIYYKTRPVLPMTLNFNPTNNSPVADNQKTIPDSLLIEAVGEALHLMNEMEFGRQLITSLIPIFILPFLLVVLSVPAFVCVQFYPPNDATCSGIVLLVSYDYKLFSLNALISPLITICKDVTFHWPLTKIPKWFTNLQHRIFHSLIQRLYNFNSNIL